jgi:hypothetical protein
VGVECCGFLMELASERLELLVALLDRFEARSFSSL